MNEKEQKKTARIYALADKAERDPKINAFSADARENESFYLGNQWGEGEAPGITRPVFNVVGRVCDYRISTLCQKNYGICYSVDGAPPIYSGKEAVQSAIDALNRHIRYTADKETLDSLIFSMVRDAVIYGSGMLYTYWDANAVTGQSYKGMWRTVPIDPACVYPADPKDGGIDSQEYFILTGRELASCLREEAERSGRRGEDLRRIQPDNVGDGKCTVYILLEKQSGKVSSAKVAQRVLISETATPLTHYPIAHFRPNAKRDSFYGESLVKAMIPNQRYINRSYCMLMKHMQDTAFSKVVYDSTKIPNWTSEPGAVIAAHGGDLKGSVEIVGCGQLAEGYRELSEQVMQATKELYGATEAALGNVDPDNTSAIIAVRDAAAGLLRGNMICLSAALEAQARIWADMMISYYGKGRHIRRDTGDWISGIDFTVIKDALLTCRIEITDLDRFGTSVTLEILNRLLDHDAITPKEYIERLPEGIIPNKESLC